MALRGPVPTPRARGFSMPAEWEPQEGVWLTWPRDPLTWPDRLDAARRVYLEAMGHITKGQRVELIVHPDLAAEARAMIEGAGIQGVVLHPIAHQDSWVRDYGPIYLRAGARRLATAWTFNAWGNKYESLLEDCNVIDRVGSGWGAPVERIDMVLEGGSIDVDGQGTLLTTRQCLLNENRNPDLDATTIEDHLKEYLGVRNVIWLGEGIEGDDTDGHVDDITRFVAPGVVATAVEPDPDHPNHAPLAANLETLRAARDAAGRRLKILEIPMPADLLDDSGDPLPASHLNFLIANAVVLVPTFGGPSDKVALRTLAKVFDRPVAPLDCSDLVWGMGAIHCLSQQVPLPA